MRYFLFVIVLVFSFGVNAETKKDRAYYKAKQQAEVLSGQCFNETLDKTLYNLFSNNKAEKASKKYYICLKEIIIEEIQTKHPPEYTEKMIKALNQMDDVITEFYDILYNQTNNNWYSQVTREVSIGEHYKKILEDVLYIQNIDIKDKK